jgi:hypothetical protein
MVKATFVAALQLVVCRRGSLAPHGRRAVTRGPMLQGLSDRLLDKNCWALRLFAGLSQHLLEQILGNKETRLLSKHLHGSFDGIQCASAFCTQ